jgi:hypothetical protein
MILSLNYPRRGWGTTVENCLSIDVLHWHRLGYLKSQRSFGWAWTRDGKQVASIYVDDLAPFRDAVIQRPPARL